jgi:hypothetical protein
MQLQQRLFHGGKETVRQTKGKENFEAKKCTPKKEK